MNEISDDDLTERIDDLRRRVDANGVLCTHLMEHRVRARPVASCPYCALWTRGLSKSLLRELEAMDALEAQPLIRQLIDAAPANVKRVNAASAAAGVALGCRHSANGRQVPCPPGCLLQAWPPFMFRRDWRGRWVLRRPYRSREADIVEALRIISAATTEADRG